MTTDTQAEHCQDSEDAGQQATVKSIHHPHDKWARLVLGTTDRAKNFHNVFGPKETAGNVKTIRRRPSLFIHPDLGSSAADLLYDVETVNGRPPEYISMIELKSFNDPFAPLQMHGYLSRIWLDWADGKAERLRALPPIVVILLHTGNLPWKELLSLREAISFSGPLEKWQPEFIYHPVDLAALPVKRILQANDDLASGLLTMKFAGQENLDVRKEYTRIIRLLPPGSDLLEPLPRYVVDTAAKSRIDEVVDVLCTELPVNREDMMQTFGDSLRAEGKAEGKAEGVVRTLTLVLESRFGPLPEEVRDMIGTADAPQLDRWAVKAANAPTLDAVINGYDAS